MSLNGSLDCVNNRDNVLLDFVDNRDDVSLHCVDDRDDVSLDCVDNRDDIITPAKLKSAAFESFKKYWLNKILPDMKKAAEDGCLVHIIHFRSCEERQMAEDYIGSLGCWKTKSSSESCLLTVKWD